MIQPLARALERAKLAPDRLILAAVSGGPDSVAMLHALKALQPRGRFRLAAAHFNHHLRGSESARDEQFVRQLCDRLEVELVVGQTRLTAGANLEERARELRHAFLKRVADRLDASLIALAHQADDQAETVLMRLLRGAGVAGLSAMKEAGPGRLWRPLLTVKRAALVAYLDQIGAAWTTDSSNASRLILRNRIRHTLLPMLERDFAPGLAERLTELAAEMRALDGFITDAARTELASRRAGEGLTVLGFGDLDFALADATLREFLRERLSGLRHISRDHIEMMRGLCSGANPSGRVVLPGGWRLRRQYDFAELERTAPPAPLRGLTEPIQLACCGRTEVGASGFIFEARLLDLGTDGPVPLPADPMEALFDTAQLRGPLWVRSFRAGDRISPHGMTGSRKVQELFVDRKLPRDLRAVWPLVTSGETIVWIPGIVRSRSALITFAHQEIPAGRKVLHLRALSTRRREITSLLKNPATC
ncbi:MAG TPA: tRNA lysidine(34) synthetase TilS [Candidatus Binataceae bacterium]|nr:tRNA lysidine(34) synthetase TilS [Candidatus Binataceae bacterium]